MVQGHPFIFLVSIARLDKREARKKEYGNGEAWENGRSMEIFLFYISSLYFWMEIHSIDVSFA